MHRATIPFCMMRHLKTRLIYRQMRTRSLSNKQTTPSVGQQRFISDIQTKSFIPTTAAYSYENRQQTSPLRSLYHPHCAILYLAHYLPIAGHPVQRGMYDTHRRDFFWPHMANNVQEAIAYCSTCAKEWNRIPWQETSTAVSGVRSVQICRNGHSRTASEDTTVNQYIFVITDRYSKHTRAVPTSKSSSTHMANLFPHHWIVVRRTFDIPGYLVAYNGPQSVSNFSLLYGVTLVLNIRQLRLIIRKQTFRLNGLTAPSSRILATMLMSTNVVGTFLFNRSPRRISPKSTIVPIRRRTVLS